MTDKQSFEQWARNTPVTTTQDDVIEMAKQADQVVAEKDNRIAELEADISWWKNRCKDAEDELNDSWPVSDNPEWSV